MWCRLQQLSFAILSVEIWQEQIDLNAVFIHPLDGKGKSKSFFFSTAVPNEMFPLPQRSRNRSPNMPLSPNLTFLSSPLFQSPPIFREFTFLLRRSPRGRNTMALSCLLFDSRLGFFEVRLLSSRLRLAVTGSGLDVLPLFFLLNYSGTLWKQKVETEVRWWNFFLSKFELAWDQIPVVFFVHRQTYPDRELNLELHILSKRTMLTI